MPAAKSSKEKALEAQCRRADAFVTAGIEPEIDACHQLSAKRRISEVSLFILCYVIGAAWCLMAPQDNYLHLLGIPPMAIAMNALGILIHEGLYGLLAKQRLVEILFLNENFHLEHHLFPQVPSYNLKRVHELVWQRLPRGLYSKSYLSFLCSFFKASARADLRPCGLVFPNKNPDTV
jgi:fatty acid desaturase